MPNQSVVIQNHVQANAERMMRCACRRPQFVELSGTTHAARLPQVRLLQRS
jgi:hypothetical protein